MASELSTGESTSLVDRVKEVLACRELTVLQLSRLSEILFGRLSHYYIPNNFYLQLRTNTAVPSIYQLFALSKISNYRLVDWLRVFGHQLDELPRLGTLLHSRRTVICDSTNYDEEAWVPWFRAVERTFESDKITPITRMIAPSNARRVSWFEQGSGRSFLYAKVGQFDALAYPHVVPGSIVRARPLDSQASEQSKVEVSRRQLYLVEYSKGVTCCRLNRADGDQVVLVPEQLPFATASLHLDREVRILGLVDLEIRPLINVLHPRVPAELAKHWTPAPIEGRTPGMPLGELLRVARLRAGLPFWEASAITRKIADYFGDGRYVVAPGALSSYERLHVVPRRIHSIISLCIVYCVGFWDFLRSTDIAAHRSGRQPIPEDALRRVSSNNHRRNADTENAPEAQPFPLSVFEQIPLFLVSTLPIITGLPGLTIRDIFWTGGLTQPLHPLLEQSYLIVVNRRVKRPIRSSYIEEWERPLYLILMRDGTYICGHCTLEDDILMLQCNPKSSLPPRALRNRIDAEIVGRVVALVRSL